MKEQFIRSVYNEVHLSLTQQQWNQVAIALNHVLEGVVILEGNADDCYLENTNYLANYITSKRLEGCSEKTLAYYENTLQKLFANVSKNVKNISTEDLRKYLNHYQEEHHVSKVSLDNIRRIISGFYSWMEEEDYILKSPARRIHKVKADKVIQDTFGDEELERIFSSCTNIRDLAMICFLFSTGIRVGELVLINRKDVDFAERTCVVFGKGNKERRAYFDAKAKMNLEKYLRSRDDDSEALFVSMRKPHTRLTIGGVEKCLKRLEVSSNVADIHPHKFRRTLATMAIDKGMPIEQVQDLLGHVRIDTTMHYAQVKRENVRNGHRKYLS